ncbi:MAG: hypothetical protein ABI175_06785 [Polyangiales bacterium]
MNVALALALIAGCGRAAPPEPRPGDERAPCKAGTCGAGLVCLSDRCVRPPGADCGQVAEALTSLELGNYAPLDERRPKVAAYRAKCESLNLTVDEGRCVIAAKTFEQLRACPKPVMFPTYKPTAPGEMIKGLPAECSQYLLTLERYARCSGLPPESRASIGKAVAEMRKSWSMFSETTPMPKAVTDACVQGNTAIRQAMVSFGCR